MSYLHVDNITKSFIQNQENRAILDNVCFSEDLNRCILINGRSGSGKTTLLNTISGINTPDSGTIDIDKTTVTSLSTDKRSAFRLNMMGIVYQSFNFLPGLSVYENCIIPALMLGTTKHLMNQRLAILAEKFKVSHVLDQLPMNVSGGELQRAAIVRALINSPTLVLADEPSGNLDTENRDIIFETFRSIVKQEAVLIIMTSHDPAAKDIVDQVYNLNDGHLNHE